MDTGILISAGGARNRWPALCMVALATWSGMAAASQTEVNWEEQLAFYGFSVNSDGDIDRLLKDAAPAAKLIALYAIKEKYGKDAAPLIERFLADDHSGIRSRAAKMLADMGSGKGRVRMKADFRKNVPDGWKPSDTEIFRRFERRRVSTMEVVETAAALAKLGDADVATFVQAAALHASSPAARHSAVGAMASLMRAVDAEELRRHGVDPAATLIEVARKESWPAVLYAIHGEMGKEDIPPDVAEPILSAVYESPYLKSHVKRVVANDIAAVRRRREAAGAALSKTVAASQPAIARFSIGATRSADVPATRPATARLSVTTTQPSNIESPATQAAPP